ncbi:MAG: PBP1A family penicillin-binding protein [Candidatus Berkelbacteria bacterium]|nr:PBP1A family penicillin-binding protein [Candidatus Berkelbacteria bacterium]
MKIGGILNVGSSRKPYIKPRRVDRKKLKKTIYYAIGAFFAFIVLLFVWYAKDIPTPARLAKIHAAESTQILDRKGQVLYETGDQRRTVIDKKDIPDSIKKATVAAEDNNFYNHHGVDFRGILRALVANVLHMKVSQGGSTITQQFVKNAVLSPQRSVSRKIKEVIMSIEIEQIYSKEDILAMYLNEIPYGGNVYGVEEASNMYFNKSAKDLTLSESATLAAVANAPTYYSPYGSHTDEMFDRKNRTLDKMAKLNLITEDQAKQAKLDAPNKEKPDFKPRHDYIKAPHFVMYVKEKLVEQYGERMVNAGGLKVTTTLDMDKQNAAQDAVDKNVNKITKYGASNAALVSTDVKTGEIVAMVGGKDFFDIEHGGNVNVTDSERQPGSSFKPIVYATAFKNGRFSPAFTLYDVRTDFGGYEPQNYDGSTHGAVSMRTALANSLNIPAVKTLGLVGVPEALKTAQDLGITTLDQPQRYGLSLVLGGGEVKPIEMAGAFSAFGNQGEFHRPVAILKVQDDKGKTLYEYKPDQNKFQAIDPQIAYEITDILDDDNARKMIFGSHSPLDFGDQHVAAKTGTTQEFHDAWTVGYTPKYSAAVWVGNNDNTKMSSGADGSVVAAPIFHDYMATLVDNSEFVRPKEIQELTVEKYSSKLPSQYSKDFVKDIFASWQVPTAHDDINVVFKVNKTNNQIATDQTPVELIEDKLFTNLHNEWGDAWQKYPNWEGPVRGWAEANGMSLPPTGKDDSYSKLPDISISAPSNNQTVKNQIDITVSTSSDHGISNVVYFLNDAEIGSNSAAPYSIPFDTTKYANGTYKLLAKLTDSNGVNSSSSTIQLNIQNTKAAVISGLTVSAITANSATIYFTTDLGTSSTISYGISQNALSNSQASGTNTTSHSGALSGLSAGTKYYFKIIATNAAGDQTIQTGTFNTS